MKRKPSQRLSESQSEFPTIFSDVSDKFAQGSIQCIKLRNFMTFEKMTISPSPGLNLIIGPNGSGKSSIICAIGLGLGATTNVLARTSKLSGFIRHSCEEAKIKILLTGNPSFWVCRKISADNSTQWRIKNLGEKWKVTSAADVIQRIQALHIQLDNLCMFLPQERVKEFSTLKPYQLLTATEQAVNDEIFQRHQGLIRDFRQQQDKQQKINDENNRLQKYQSLIDSMRNDVIRLKQVEECRANIAKLEKIIPWVQFQAERAELHQIKVTLKKEVNEYKKARDVTAPLEEQINELRKKRNSSTKPNDIFNAAKKQFSQYSDGIFKASNRIQTIQGKIKVIKEEEDQRKKDIEKCKSALAELTIRSQSADSGSADELEQNIREIKSQMKSNKSSQNEIRSQVEDLKRKIDMKSQAVHAIESKISIYEGAKKRLLDHISTRRKDVVDVYHYIQENKHLFAGEIYGPICCEVNFPNSESADILQMVVENHILFSFLVENEDDYESLNNFLNSNHLNQITLLKPSRSSEQSQRTPLPDLRQYGFTAYVDELFDAPLPVKQMLIKIAALDRIPIAKGQAAQRNIEQLVDQYFLPSGIIRYFIDKRMYTMYKSRDQAHGRSVTTVSNNMRPSSIWTETGSAADDIKELNAKKQKKIGKINLLKEDLKKMQVDSDKLRREYDKLANSITEYKKKLADQLSIREKQQRLKDKIDSLQKEGRNLPKKVKEYEESIKQLVSDMNKTNDYQYKATMQMIEAQYEIDRIQTEQQKINTQLMELEERLEEEKQKFKAQGDRIIELKNQKEDKKRVVDRLKKEAEEKCPLNNDENKKLIPEMQKDIDVINAELSRLRSRYASISNIDPQLADRYADAEKNRDKSIQRLKEMNEELDDLNKNVTQQFTQWKTDVLQDVEKINKAFIELMTTCGYRGEVQLAWDDKEKIESYKLNLLVAFNRTSDLNILSSTRQSGGEKSVTTLLYLLALQDCTKFPFRVVDEINQGMDEVNDRNTFFQVMSYAMRRNQASQYFLVTPKLLPQLDLMDGVTVLVVMNGPFVDGSLNSPITFDSALPH